MWWRLVFKEILRRKWGFLFSVAAIAIAIGALALVEAVTESLSEEARLIGVRMKHNIVILPADVPLDDYYRGDFGASILPESLFQAVRDESTGAMMDKSGLSRRLEVAPWPQIAQAIKDKGEDKVTGIKIPELADHYLAELQERAEAEAGGRKMAVILTGRQAQKGRKAPPDEPPTPGNAFLGAAVAEQLALKAGDTIRIRGRELHVARVEPSQDTMDDIRVKVALSDAQAMLDRPGAINRVVAIGCICGLTIGEVTRALEMHINRWIADKKTDAQVRVFAMERLATARLNIRSMINSVKAVLGPVFLVICGALVCGYFYFNVRERRQEMGVLMAIGFKPGPILLAILLKLALVSVIGGAVGTVAGLSLATALGPVFLLSKVIWPAGLWLWTMGLAVGLTLLSGVYPLVLAMRTRAADILRNS